MTLAEELRALADEIGAKLVEPVIEKGCTHDEECRGHVGYVRWLGMERMRDDLATLAARAEREAAFLEAAKRYCREWMADHRNSSNTDKIMGRLSKARGALYDAYRALIAEEKA